MRLKACWQERHMQERSTAAACRVVARVGITIPQSVRSPWSIGITCSKVHCAPRRHAMNVYSATSHSDLGLLVARMARIPRQPPMLDRAEAPRPPEALGRQLLAAPLAHPVSTVGTRTIAFHWLQYYRPSVSNASEMMAEGRHDLALDFRCQRFRLGVFGAGPGWAPTDGRKENAMPLYQTDVERGGPAALPHVPHLWTAKVHVGTATVALVGAVERNTGSDFVGSVTAQVQDQEAVFGDFSPRSMVVASERFEWLNDAVDFVNGYRTVSPEAAEMLVRAFP